MYKLIVQDLRDSDCSKSIITMILSKIYNGILYSLFWMFMHIFKLMLIGESHKLKPHKMYMFITSRSFANIYHSYQNATKY